MPESVIPAVPEISLIFIAIFALLQVPIALAVGIKRVRTGILLMDGGDETILRLQRAHANFTENVPICLLVMAAAEWSGTPVVWIWAGGWCLLVARIWHWYALATQVVGVRRAAGMILTFTPMLGFGAITLLNLLFN